VAVALLIIAIMSGALSLGVPAKQVNNAELAPVSPLSPDPGGPEQGPTRIVPNPQGVLKNVEFKRVSRPGATMVDGAVGSDKVD